MRSQEIGSAITHLNGKIVYTSVVGKVQSTAELYVKLRRMVLHAIPCAQVSLRANDQRWRPWLQQSMSVMFSLCWNPFPSPQTLFPGPGTRAAAAAAQAQGFSSLLSTTSAAGLPVPSQSQGKAPHGDNGQLFHIPHMKTSPMFVTVAYALRCKQQGRLSSALAVPSPPSLLQTDGPHVQVMSRLHLANKSNNQNHHCIHKE